MPPLHPPLADAKNFSLNSAGVAGFFGGKEAISAMATVHMYKGRRWLGWFNSPGSYVIAKRFGRMANSRFWDGLFPGSNDSPAVTFGLDGKRGPKYIAALSGTEMKTGHLAYLTIERTKNMDEDVIEGRQTRPIGVTYLAMKPVNYNDPVKCEPLYHALLGLIPISVSVVTSVMCAIYHDWYSFSMIVLGVISSGLASITIGKGRLVIKSVTNPASGAPPGHGILMGDDEVVVIKGNEQDVNAITKGHFVLETGSKRTDKKEGVGPEQGDKEKRCSNGRCSCAKQVDEGNNTTFESCGNGKYSDTLQGDEEDSVNPKHADQVIFAEVTAVVNGKGKGREVEPITEETSDFGTGLEQSEEKEGINPKQGGEAKFVEEVMLIEGKEREVDPIASGRPVLQTSLEQSNKGISPKRVGEENGIELVPLGKGEGSEVEKDDEVQCTDLERGDEQRVTEPGPHSHRGDNGPKKDYHKNAELPYHAIGFSSLLLILQFLLQLLLIPQGSLFGQIMFLVSLGVSWGYNSYLSSLEKEKIQTKLLFQTLGNPEMRRFLAGTRTTMTVFVCLLLFHGVECKSLKEKKDQRMRIIRSCVPNDTPVWERWLDKVMQQILNLDEDDSLPCLQMNTEDKRFSAKDRELLRGLLKDAAAAFRKYLSIREELPEVLSSIIEKEETGAICPCGPRCHYCECNAPI